MIPILIKIGVLLSLLQIALAATPSNSYELVPPEPNQDVYSLVQRYFPTSSVDTALRIIKAESSFNPLAKNSSSSASGLFQITRDTKKDFCPQADLFLVEDNIKCAVSIYLKTGWSRWSASGNWK